MTLLSGHAWFDKPLPSIFHLVLASYLLVVGTCLRRNAAGARPE